MTCLPPDQVDLEICHKELELAASELKVALIFAEFSSTSYSLGKLQHATDARSKAELACTRAAARLTAPIDEAGVRWVNSMLSEVRNALAGLPASLEFNVRARHAAG